MQLRLKTHLKGIKMNSILDIDHLSFANIDVIAIRLKDSQFANLKQLNIRPSIFTNNSLVRKKLFVLFLKKLKNLGNKVFIIDEDEEEPKDVFYYTSFAYRSKESKSYRWFSVFVDLKEKILDSDHLNVHFGLTFKDCADANIKGKSLRRLLEYREIDLSGVNDYDDGIKEYLNGNINFYDLFGKNRLEVKSSHELLMLVKSKYFVSMYKRPIKGDMFVFPNIRAALIYQHKVLTEEVTAICLDILLNNDVIKHSYEAFILIKKMKAHPEKYKVPKEYQLLLEVQDY